MSIERHKFSALFGYVSFLETIVSFYGYLHAEPQPRRAKNGDGKRRSKKAKANDEEHEDEDIDCEGMDKILKKGDEDDEEDRGNGLEGSGGGVFDTIPSGITSWARSMDRDPVSHETRSPWT